jgi:fructose-bisphosphate aldolase class I
MILVVGNVTKDVYLNLDSRSEHFETDANHTAWLDLSFDSSTHHFFNRFSSLGGASISSEVLSNFGLDNSIAGLDGSSDKKAAFYRYILVADNGVSYLSPSDTPFSNFTAPETAPDYIYIDRSAHLSSTTVEQITDYLNNHTNTKLVIYLHDKNKDELSPLLPLANLVFIENHPLNAGDSYAPDLAEFASKISAPTVNISTKTLSCQNITENIQVNRIDTITHLSVYSIASATILASFITGKTIEQSLRLARLNVENSTIESTLSLHELSNLSSSPLVEDLELIAATLVHLPKGILAADESGGSIQKKFAQLDIPDTYQNRHDYRDLFFTAPDLDQHVNGIILFDETARDHMNTGEAIPDYLISKCIIPGIKVDQGLENFPNSTETYTKGLDTLPERLREYYQMGLRFAKWRAAFEIRLSSKGTILTPTDEAIQSNCDSLADYAKACQKAGLVPIVEPEIVYDGYYDIDQSAEITGKILDQLFQTLQNKEVNLRACILKVNMILAGKQFNTQSSPAEIGTKTAEVLKKHVPEDLAGVVFLSGGQSPEQATDNLTEIIKNGPFPWPVTFSFARALQDPALFAWQGDNNNAEKARQAFLDRLIANQTALTQSSQQ